MLDLGGITELCLSFTLNFTVQVCNKDFPSSGVKGNSAVLYYIQMGLVIHTFQPDILMGKQGRAGRME